MKAGTKSVLWGVHAFWFHPIVVGLAWHKIHNRWPNRWEWIAIATHDLGYVGCSELDGPDGKLHPYVGARIGKSIARFFGAREYEALHVEELVLGHSRSFCDAECKKLSDLCDPDKLSVLYDPAIFYWLRGTLSDEFQEYWHREEQRHYVTIKSSWEWLRGYRRAIKARFSKRT